MRIVSKLLSSLPLLAACGATQAQAPPSAIELAPGNDFFGGWAEFVGE